MSVITAFRIKKLHIENIARKIIKMTSKKQINNLTELDRYLAFVDEQFLKSDDAGRDALESFYYSPRKMDIPNDPYSEEYHNFQMRLYSLISGNCQYSINNEESIFDLESKKNTPFPYYTKSATTVGDQLLAIGYIIKQSNMPSNSKVLEFGPGWGNLTIALAQMGHNVTCVEVEKRFAELIAYRASLINTEISIINHNMLEFVKKTDQKFDAIFFYESFHHCSNPIELVQNLPNIINKGGIICFASEPIVNGPSFIIPYPWGIRLDGMSVWSIRKFGWMELGFKKDFFLDLLSKNGFVMNEFASDVSPLTHLIIAKENCETACIS